MPGALPTPDDEEHKVAYVTEKRGVHYAVIYEGRNPVTGTERRRWHCCDDRTDAERLAAELAANRDRQSRGGSSMTVRDYMEGRWLPARESTIAASTHARECAAVAHYVLPHLGTTQLRRLRPEHIQTLYRRLAIAGSRTGGPLAAKTILNLHQTLRAAFGDATAYGLLAINPIDGVRPPDPRTRPSGRRRARSWTASELGTFLDATSAGRHAALFRLAAATGMRRGEVLGLRWDTCLEPTWSKVTTGPGRRSGRHRDAGTITRSPDPAFLATAWIRRLEQHP